MRYTGCFGYGDAYPLRKEECKGHVQKRMGTGLREMKKRLRGIKLADGKSLGGRNRLTDKMIDKFQNSYGFAIRWNTGDLDGMITSIWAVYEHMIMDDQTPLPEQHGKCPKTSDTKCCLLYTSPSPRDS